MGNYKVIGETWKGRGSAAPLAKGLNNVARVINNPEGVGGIYAYVRNGRLVIENRSRGIDLSIFCFGLTISGPTATIKAGEITWGTADFQIEDTEVEITSDLQMIGLQCSHTEAQIIGPSTDLATFRSTDTIKRCWLYKFGFTAGTEGRPGKARLLTIGKPVGNWDIGSEFAPS